MVDNLCAIIIVVLFCIKVGAKVIGWGAASGAGLYGLEKNFKK
ncbi:GatB family leaderless bacteriocin [Staphylococcus aureus]|nr:GatB family leaderless bacteriocin [Staphylococcus aureus]MCM0472520.1 GatB family leaderless bacteriocin [Staphylococcus aureus]MCM0482889.1 GatB family leaderless bacteriocin [Staphylococcus aureus]MCM0569108.1 GatB family leaderless bacteriocin [Staphylococcus aureus]